MLNIKITGTGSVIPQKVLPNAGFSKHSFFDASGLPIDNPNIEIIENSKQLLVLIKDDTSKIIKLLLILQLKLQK